MKTATTNKQKVIYYCSNHPHCLLNSAVLILSYMTFVRDSSLAEVYGPFYGCEPLTTYRDAAFCLNTYLEKRTGSIFARLFHLLERSLRRKHFTDL